MDQKKTLWIIAAVGAFLLVVLGAALILYSPEKKQASVASASYEKKADVASSGWTNTPSLEAPNNQQIPLPPPMGNSVETNEMIVFSDNTTVVGMGDSNPYEETTFDLNTLKQEKALDQYAQQNQSVQPSAQNINITVNLPETSVNLNQTEQKVVTNDYYVTNVQEKAPKAKEVKEPKPAKYTEAPKTAVTTTSKSTAKTATTTVTTTVNTTKAVTQYWVQVAAYSNKKGAEGARAVLDENKIPADVFTYEDNKSRLFYRVRVGPYTTKSEAEYWRTKIIKINEFSKAESFITSTTN